MNFSKAKYLGLFVVVILIAGCVNITGLDGQQVIIVETAEGLGIEVPLETIERELVAKIKGSIYEGGETVTVFGTCLDADDIALPAVNATFSAWYPNATQFINISSADNFSEFQEFVDRPGYFIYTAPMNVVQGTYLTQLECELNGQVAKALGEWQNPFWVSKINNTLAAVQNISIQIGDLQTNISDAFEITWDKIESVNNTIIDVGDNLTIIINEVGQIANNSVDRNDSYIVSLLNNILINGTFDLGPGGNLSFTEEFDDPVFHGLWEIEVTAFIGTTQVGSEAVSCFINTTNSPPTLNAQFEPISGPKFFYAEIVKSRFDFDWDVGCILI